MAWARQCNINDANCEVLPADVYKIYYLQVRNGYPTLITDPLLIAQYDLKYQYNQVLFRHWYRDETEQDVEDFLDNGCRSFHYAAIGSPTIIDQRTLRLPDNQILRITSSQESITCATGKSINTEYFNISDSWVDVFLYVQGIYQQMYRVYGANPDPWDAPLHIQNEYSQWPPNFGTVQTCSHITGVASGQQKNGANITGPDNVYSETIPIEKSSWAVQGPWSGRLYQTLSHNTFAHNIISTQYENIRIEKIATGGYKLYISFGENRIEGFDSAAQIIIADNNNQWDTNPYYITFDLVDNEILNYQSLSGYYPDWVDETVRYDSALDIDLIGNRLFINNSFYDILTTEGYSQHLTIFNEQAADFINQGYTPSLVEAMPLLKKIGV